MFYACLESQRSELPHLLSLSINASVSRGAHSSLMLYWCGRSHTLTTQAIVGGNIHFVRSFAFSVKCTKACTIVKFSFLVREPSINGFYPLTQSFILKAEIESEGICVHEE